MPVPEFVLAELSRIRENRTDDDLVFPGRGRRVSPAAEVAARLVRRRGEARRGAGDHPARFAAHVRIARGVAGVNVLALQRMLGHKSAKVTLDTYADLFDTDLDAVAVTLHSRYSLENAAEMRPRGAL